MNWKDVVVLALILLAATGLIFAIHGCFSEGNRAYSQEQQQWMNFVQQHHCHIVQSPWYAENVWQCDGFQVEHQ